MRQPAIIALLSVALGVSTCSYHNDLGYGAPAQAAFGAYRYAGAAYDEASWDQAKAQLAGPGAAMLDPWLAVTAEGRAILARGFKAEGSGIVTREVAERANLWFRRYADHDHDMLLTDGEIRVALVQAARKARPSGY